MLTGGGEVDIFFLLITLDFEYLEYCFTVVGENSHSPVPPPCSNSNPSSEKDIYSEEFQDCQDDTDGGGEKIKV